MSVDVERLMASASRFDEQADRVDALIGTFSGIVDAAVSGANPDTAALAPMRPRTDEVKDALRQIGEFCAGMADRVRAAARTYATTDAEILAASQHVHGDVAAPPAQSAPPGPEQP
ncbi:MAG TPA: hypothetical protein VD813_15915 [Pseudonocardia sp.]|nr:hypothetical protein [Pseudonocardia sp.]